MDKYCATTFEWPALHDVRQKPLDPLDMDDLVEKYVLGSGSHMTLAVFIKTPGGDHRSQPKKKKEMQRVYKEKRCDKKEKDSKARRMQKDTGVLLLADRGERDLPR